LNDKALVQEKAQQIAKAAASSPTTNTTTGVSSKVRNYCTLSRIYVGSIHFELTEEPVRIVFSQFGAIKNISMSTDPVTKKHKGFCFIEFDTPEAAALATQIMNGADFGGR
jgi:poly(U)-binding-splicing factor PUF60